MASDYTEIPVGNGTDAPSKRSGKVRLIGLSDLDQRTRTYAHVREMMDRITADLGGADHLSTLEPANVEHTALLAAMVRHAAASWLQGEDLDPAAIATLQNCFK